MPFEHYCQCGEWGAYGFARPNQEYQWYCDQHRPDWTPNSERSKHYRIRCTICGENIEDPSAPGTFQWTSGWVQNRRGGGGHALSLPKRHPYWAHKSCLERKIKGWIGQGQMFEPEEGGP